MKNAIIACLIVMGFVTLSLPAFAAQTSAGNAGGAIAAPAGSTGVATGGVTKAPGSAAIPDTAINNPTGRINNNGNITVPGNNIYGLNGGSATGCAAGNNGGNTGAGCASGNNPENMTGITNAGGIR